MEYQGASLRGFTFDRGCIRNGFPQVFSEWVRVHRTAHGGPELAGVSRTRLDLHSYECRAGVGTRVFSDGYSFNVTWHRIGIGLTHWMYVSVKGTYAGRSLGGDGSRRGSTLAVGDEAVLLRPDQPATYGTVRVGMGDRRFAPEMDDARPSSIRKGTRVGMGWPRWLIAPAASESSGGRARRFGRGREVHLMTNNGGSRSIGAAAGENRSHFDRGIGGAPRSGVLSSRHGGSEWVRGEGGDRIVTPSAS